jgi:hypothetical protein
MNRMKSILVAGTLLSGLLIASGSYAGTPGVGGPDDYPPNAVPGHCYQHVMVPAVTEDYQERVVDTPEHTATRTIPAVYDFVDKRVLVREGHIDRTLVPPTYRTVTETEVIRPETTRTEVIPARYDTVTERVMVQGAHTEWRRGYGPVSDPDMPRVHVDRDILCLIDVPAEYRLETRRVLISPERTTRTTIPEEVRVRTREVIDQPEHEITREVPPIYSTVKERVVVQPERVETYTVPATYRMITKTRVVAPGHYEWREYACRDVRHPMHHARPPVDPSNDGERGALDPAKGLGGLGLNGR